MCFFVVSNLESRRTDYFIKAGIHLGVDTRFLTYEELLWRLPKMQRAVVKLEPLIYQEVGLAAYAELCAGDRRMLEDLENRQKAVDVHFLNSPRSIALAWDKLRCKEALLAAGLPVTPLLATEVTDFDTLSEIVAATPRGVFLKSRYGSGAGGMMAIRYQSRRNLWVAYTTLAHHGTWVYNTKKIHRLTDKTEIAILAKAVLEIGALVEEWVPKESFGGRNYDLRLVCRQEEVDYAVVRYSNGAITNLHLNNQAGNFEELELAPSLQHEIFELSVAAARVMGLYYAGVDVLVEKTSSHPAIIAVNGQGDHIYQDIFYENRIYTRQIQALLHAEKYR